eukprot:CAMPEP_0197845190 /NCGR_PEP_ID=MMETSP1438-20131217/2146_1 /TAXON_ID=1461541 /ORGANISM="Pterosperma sp., Strain CCMP1384" /LENGTH=57 /DNA_ID=CAMNT_0043456363 /DNA_START=112 /DNA_END=282 /DNA_ORIENTATION=-
MVHSEDDSCRQAKFVLFLTHGHHGASQLVRFQFHAVVVVGVGVVVGEGPGGEGKVRF